MSSEQGDKEHRVQLLVHMVTTLTQLAPQEIPFIRGCAVNHPQQESQHQHTERVRWETIPQVCTQVISMACVAASAGSLYLGNSILPARIFW